MIRRWNLCCRNREVEGFSLDIPKELSCEFFGGGNCMDIHLMDYSIANWTFRNVFLGDWWKLANWDMFDPRHSWRPSKKFGGDWRSLRSQSYWIYLTRLGGFRSISLESTKIESQRKMVSTQVNPNLTTVLHFDNIYPNFCVKLEYCCWKP